MPLNIQITKPQVYDRYGALMNVGTTYLVDDDFGRSLVQSLRGIDVAGILSYPLSMFSPTEDFQTLDAIDTPNDGVADTTEQQLNPRHRAIPSNFIKINDRFEIPLSLAKSGASDTATFRLRYGPLGTTADPVIATINNVATTTRTYGGTQAFKRVSATQIQRLGSGDPNFPFSSGSPVAFPAPVTVGDMTNQPMFLSITAQMTAGTEFATVNDYAFKYFVTDTNQS